MKLLIILAILSAFFAGLKNPFTETNTEPEKIINQGEPESMNPPFVIINSLPPESQRYVGSPSITIMPNGDYIASHDIFGPNAAQKEAETLIFRSTDGGNYWRKMTHMTGQAWSTLFHVDNDVYIIGTVGFDGGMVVIRKSEDNGRTWTEPQLGEQGIIAVGENKGFHTAPVPVIFHNGRVWRSMEDMNAPGHWPENFRTMVMSAPIESDLLNPVNWTISNTLSFNPSWGDFRTTAKPGWLEGNIVVTPQGKLVNILRLHTIPTYDLAAMASVSDDGTTISFNPSDPNNTVIDFPGGLSKFTIRYDPVSKKYWSIVNKISNPNTKDGSWEHSVYHQRNVLALTSSKDLFNWEVDYYVVRYNQGAALDKNNTVGFQYADWQIDGDDIVAVVRTAYDGAHTYHDANMLAFFRIPDFRDVTISDSPPDLHITTGTMKENEGD